jgi:hypothetical protein
MRSASRRNEAAMTKKRFWIGVVLALLGAVTARGVRAQDWDRSTHVRFAQPMDISGHVIAPGSYWFTLQDVNSRHIVRIFNDDRKKVVLTVMTVPDYRLAARGKAEFEFYEVPAGTPKALRAWFYPDDGTGEEFFYPKHRALALAKASNVAVPAYTAKGINAASLDTADLFAVTPFAEEVPLASAIQTTPLAREPVVTVANYLELPKTASLIPGVLFVGLGFLILGLALKVIVTRM